MRKLIFIMILATLASLASCAHMPRGGDLQATRDSVYKVRVTMKLDLKPLNDWIAKKNEERKKREDERKKGEEQKRFPWRLWSQETVTFLRDVPVRLSSAQVGTEFSIIQQNDDTAEIGWSGTGWVGAKAPGRSYVMTAGHVCESKDSYSLEVMDVDWDAGIISVETIELPIIEKHHRMQGRDGIDSVDATIVRDEDLNDNFDGNDLCMLGVPGDLGPAIPVATEEPEYGQACSVVGAPTGLWGGGIAVASEALFSGRGSVFGTDLDGLAFNGLLAPGNSGSAVTCDGRAVGVISLGSTRFRSLIHAVPYDRIEVFMRKALHRK